MSDTETTNGAGAESPRAIKLSPQLERLILLIGRDRLSYKAVARELGVSQHTVRQYATRIRDRIGSDRSPRDALTVFYIKNRERFEPHE